MDSFRKISRHSRLWIAPLAAAALSIGAWSIAPAPANAGVVVGVGIPFPGLYAQYPYYPYPPGYYPYYPPPAPAYAPVPSYAPQPSYSPQEAPSGGNITRQLNRQELNRLQAAPINPPPSILSISTAAALLKTLELRPRKEVPGERAGKW
jgi:hypothetical protein